MIKKALIESQSARCLAAYAYSSSGVFESSTDLVFSGHLLIGEDGIILKQNKRFQRDNEVITSIIDVDKLKSERMKNVSYRDSVKLSPWVSNVITFEFKDTALNTFDRYVDKHPFVPSNENLRDERCREIFNIQASTLAKRIIHTWSKKSYYWNLCGLDSTLALLVIKKTFDMLNIPRKNIITITMPGFGTTDRTYNNAINLCKNLGCEFREINITNACIQHFKDINHDINIHDVTYENVQARERTQILMDVANKEGGPC